MISIRLKRHFVVLSLAALVFVLAAIFYLSLSSSTNSEKSEKVSLVEANLNGVKLYIPKDYLKFRHTSVGTESALLQAWYPGAGIPPGDSDIDLTKQGIWWKNVRILINARGSDIGIDEFSRKATNRLNATEFVQEEF